MMKRIVRFFMSMIAVSAVTLIGSFRAAAQFNDPINTAVNAAHSAGAAADAWQQFLAMLDQLNLGEEQLGKLKDWNDKMQKWNSDIQAAKDFIDKMEDYAMMIKRVQNQIELLTMYGNMIKSTATSDFNQYYLTNLLHYGTQMGYAIDGLMDMISVIMKEDGMTKAERQSLIDDRTSEINVRLAAMETKVNDELSYLMNLSEIVVLENLFLGRRPAAGLNCVGAEVSYSQSPPSSSAPVVGDSEVMIDAMKGNGGTLRRIILIIIGISSLGSLIFAFARYASGAYESEKAFIRIFSVIIIVFVIFGIIASMLN